MSDKLTAHQSAATSLDQQADVVRRMWRHEDTIANHRVTWFTASQGLLFTALTIGLKEDLHHLVPILIVLGLGSSLLTLLSMWLGVRDKKVLQTWWHLRCDHHDIPPLCGFYLAKDSLLSYLAPSNLLPLLFGAGWLAVILAYF